MNKLYVLSGFFCLIIAISSCKKTKVDNETTSSTDYALVSQEFMQLITNCNIAAVNQRGLNSSDTMLTLAYPGQKDSLSGDTIHDASGTFTNTANLPVLWIKYTNCNGKDGKIRNGTIRVSFTKQCDQIGSVATFTFSNYSVDGISCQGTVTYTRNSSNGFTCTVTDGALSNGSWTTKYNCNMVLTLYDNNTLGVPNDDYLMVLGNANGINREGKKYDVSISESLKKKADCAWISQGIANLTPEGLHTRTINFGNGTCDDVASFTIDSQTFTIHMSK